MLDTNPKTILPWYIRILRGVIIVAALSAIVLAILGSPWLIQFLRPSPPANHSSAFAQQDSATPSAVLTATETLAPTATATPFSPQPFEAGGAASLDGLMILSISESGYTRLFSHQLLGQPFTRLTAGEWDDIDPAISADGQHIAFGSDRSGAWNLYLLDLLTGVTTPLTDDPEYDGHPSWSSDGAWLAYEHTIDGDQEIFMQPIDGSVDPVLISAGSAANYAPAWRPNAQEIAFVSDRGGMPQIWIVDLEAEGEARFQQLVGNTSMQNSPAWSPDGAWLAWSQLEDGTWTIYAQNFSGTNSKPRRIGLGMNPRWSISGSTILAEIRSANETYLTAYTLSGGLALAPELMPSDLDGIAWGVSTLPDPLPESLLTAAQATPGTIPARSSNSIIDLADVNAPFPQIDAAAQPAFDALRARAAQLLGWDAFSELSNAFLPLDEPLPPDRQQDWLYTGRAFELHSGLLDAGWMVIVKEEFESNTYWRVYLKAAGDLGRPLNTLPWDLKARFSSVESDYQAGGELAETLPAGAWLDFTALASDFGFERVPALGNWRSYYQGALFNQFIFRQGLTWQAAMLQIYSTDEIPTSRP